MSRSTTRRDLSAGALTDAVVASFAGTADDRLATILAGLVRHLHAFAADVALTEEEWSEAVAFLTATGQISSATRQEVILLSDVLGLSMQVIGINHPAPGRVTESTVFGPFFVDDAPAYANGDDLANGAPGELCFMSGTVRAPGGTPIAGARIDVWQADDDGLYDVQYEGLEAPRGRGHLHSAGDGRFWFWSVKPEPYPIPSDGPVGRLLRATGRSPMRPAHVHFRVTAPGYATVTTHVFAAGDPHLDSDAVFGVKESLVAPFTRHDAGTAPDGRAVDVPYWTMAYDLVLAPGPGA